jgi:hypothetical protein
MLECYPGLTVRELGYVCVAGCVYRSGDQYYICNADGGDPPLYQLAHDISDVGATIIANGRYTIFDRLSDFFDAARPQESDNMGFTQRPFGHTFVCNSRLLAYP